MSTRRPFLMEGFIFLVVLSLAQVARAQVSPMEIANLREDVRALNQKVGELSLNLEQLQRENAQLKTKPPASYATLAQLNEAVAELNRTFQSALSAQKQETLQQVGTQMEKLAKQTQAALDGTTKSTPAKGTQAGTTGAFADDYSKEGVTYVVQKGDSLSSIARKNNSTTRDIINANKIADATKVVVGQTLFIPQKKN